MGESFPLYQDKFAGEKSSRTVRKTFTITMSYETVRIFLFSLARASKNHRRMYKSRLISLMAYAN